MTEICATCRHAYPDDMGGSSMRSCRRYPAALRVVETYGCGEWEDDEMLMNRRYPPIFLQSGEMSTPIERKKPDLVGDLGVISIERERYEVEATPVGLARPAKKPGPKKPGPKKPYT
jgi:hypothetical protein